eukprot:CFRG5821T1
MDDPVVVDVMVVKGVRCPKGYTLLNLSPEGHIASLTRKSFTRADIFLCTKMELNPSHVITDITCIEMGKEPVPHGFTLIESRAGGLRVMVAVKRSAAEEATHVITNICATLPKKEVLEKEWRIHKKNLGDDIHLGYKRVKLGTKDDTSELPQVETQLSSSPTMSGRPMSVYSSNTEIRNGETSSYNNVTSSLYPTSTGQAPPASVPVGAMWEEGPPTSPQMQNSHLQYPSLSGVTVILELPGSAKDTDALKLGPTMRAMNLYDNTVDPSLDYDFSVENEYAFG